MAKKQITNYKFVPGTSSPSTNLYPETFSLLDKNKKFIQEETIAYIAYNVANNISPYIYYTYNAEKCRRDVSYVLEGYLSDLRHGGNQQTVFVAGYYWIGGVAQIDGDRQPEVFAHTFIKGLIQNFVLVNIAYTSLQTISPQVIDNSLTAETVGKTRLSTLADIIINVINNGVSSLPAVVNTRGFIKFPGTYKLKDLLLITNTSRNTIMYNFADPANRAEIIYSETFDADFAGALYGNEKITTIILDSDTSNMMVTDNIQIFVEAKEQTVRLNPIATDAMERMKVGIPQSMLDADFEYGLQPTKWQTISFMRGYPSVYEIPGSDLSVLSVTTDASSGNALSGTGASLMTVLTATAHGLAVNNIFTIKALANSITGFSRAEGTFAIATIPSATTFTYYAKAKVGTTNGEQLSSTYTQLRKAAYYTGANVSTPTFSVYSAGSSGSITTQFTTAAGVDIIGFTGSAPPIGAPVTGTGIPTGAQITAVVGAAGATTSLTTTAAIGDSQMIVDITSNISAGMITDRGDGVSIQVTNVVGNTVSLSGALTSAIIGSTQSYAGLNQGATTGSGTGAQFTVSRSASAYLVTVTSPGSGYAQNDVCTIYGVSLGGTNTTNNATIIITAASSQNGVATLNAGTLTTGSVYTIGSSTDLSTSGGAGTGLTVDATLDQYGLVTAVDVRTPGSGYAVGNTIRVLSGITRGVVQGLSQLNAGFGYNTTTGVSLPGGTGTGLVVDIVADVAGGASAATITNAGTGYTSASSVAVTGGSGSGMTLNSITAVAGQITQLYIGNKGTGYALNDVVTVSGGGGNATLTLTSVSNREILSINPTNYGTGYTQGDTFNIPGGTNGQFSAATVSKDVFINVATVSAGGVIQSATISGTPITAPTKAFYGAVTISDITSAEIPTATSLTYSAIATVQVEFPAAHGFVPGDTVTSIISSTDTGAQLAAGAFFVEQVPEPKILRYTARTAGSIANTLSGNLYGRPDSFYIHRPFDGGVQLGTASPSHGAGAVRMSKKYIRYQSGKGVTYNTGALFAPSYDIQSLTATGTATGSIITVTTDDVDHGCQVGARITISGVTTSGYNGVYTVADIITERRLTVIAVQVLGNATADLGNPCQISVRTWHGSTVRSGIFDEQNGMFYQYDGMTMAVGRRSSTFQVAGVINILSGSNQVTGVNTRFRSQLTAGDRIVIRGMTHVVSTITNDTSLTVTPSYRGVSNGVGVKLCKVQDIIIPQADWNIDPCNGSGPSGYNLDVTKMQMIGIQHTWYGAGFIDFMLRGGDGNYIFVHRFRNSNVNTEAYMRTGNQPVRYEVINEGAKGRLSAAMDISQTTIPLSATDAYWFPTAGIVYIENEMIRYTGNNGTALTGCSRSAQSIVFQAGSQRTFTAGPASEHAAGTGVILISNTITPNISHWGSAFMIDGQFDADRGYIFNYAATGINISVEKVTAFLMRLSPSVSNAQTGDLGDKELLNRAQLLLSSLAITSDAVAGGGGIVIEGVINPINYPEDPTKITWTGLNSQAAGGQPSFAQIALGGSVQWSGNASTSTATIQGAFTTTITAKSFAASTTNITAQGFNRIVRNLTVYGLPNVVQNPVARPLNYNGANANSLLAGRNTFVMNTSEYNALTTPMAIGDYIYFQNYTYQQRITQIRVHPTNGLTEVTIDGNSVNTMQFPNTATGVMTSNIGNTYQYAFITNRNDILIRDSDYTTAFTGGSTTALRVGDYLYFGGNFVGIVTSFTTSFTRVQNIQYTRIVLDRFPYTNGANRATSAMTMDAIDSITYNLAISASRNDFLIAQSTYASTLIGVILPTDGLASGSQIAGGQTLSSITQNYTTIAGVAYTRIVMSGLGSINSGSTGGTNTVVVTSNITATYASAIATTRNDLLMTNAQYASSGIAVGDTLSASTNINASQTITQIIQSYTTISSVAYTRIVMSAVANGTTTAGGSQDQTVTITAAGTAASYTRTNFLFFTKSTFDASGALVSTKVATDQTAFTAGTSIANYTERQFGTVASAVTGAVSSGGGTTVTYTLTGTQLYAVGSRVTVAGITGGTAMNGTFVVTSSSAGTLIVTSTGSGTPSSYTGASVIGTTVYRVVFTQSSNTTLNAAATLKFQFGALYALPGEQVFSFIANPGDSQTLSLDALKELTSTAIGGRGTFPNGPDVLAINVYKVSGTATNANVIVRWGEAQA
jgi:hypothetical protein